MKKNLLGLLLFSCMGLLVSCSDDDNNNTSGLDAGQIHISATLPEGIAAGQPAITGHKLRCILELWTKGEGTGLAYRSETAVEPAADGVNKVSIDLTADAGAYDCLMWADYIDVDAAADGARYADKYYDTSDLKNITVKEMNSLIDNDACDAFFYSGEVRKRAGEAFVLETELVRPFTKVSVLEKNLREFNLLQVLAASYEAPAAFNVGTGKASDELETVNHSVAAFNPVAMPDGTLFSTYIFANEESAYMDEIHLTFTNKYGTQHVTVPSDLVPLSRNRHVKVSGNMMSESPEDDTQFDIVFDIDIDDWETGNTEIASVPIAVKVGDFIYKDGTYGQAYNEDAIGIVFALNEGVTDASDYGEAFAGKEIAGYAMALESTDRIYIGIDGKITDFTDGTDITKLEDTEAYNADYTKLSYSGFEYSKAFDAVFENCAESKLFNQYKNLQEKYAHSAANFSGWYIPSAHQMYDICARTYGVDGDESAKNTALRAAYDMVVESLGTNARLNGNSTRSAWPLTSSFDRASKANQPAITLLLEVDIAPVKSKTRGNWTLTAQYFLRPVLTVFK